VIRLVTFDLYQTLCYGQPSRNERLARILGELGHQCDPECFVRPNVLAEELYTIENGRHALHVRAPDERERFYAEMYELLLREAGHRHDLDFVREVRAGMARLQNETRWLRFDDVLPTFAALRERGLQIGVISNTSTDATVLCTELDVCERVDFVVSSCLVGCEKPDPRIFHAALELGHVDPQEAVHVGDQPRSDALGATQIGMHALLLDRHNLLADEPYQRIQGLADILTWLDV
jgi:HAD superfamily hydrolase (TIGR01509 family)